MRTQVVGGGGDTLWIRCVVLREHQQAGGAAEGEVDEGVLLGLGLG